ncbi:dipeptidase [Sphingomonas turrisvirgatae]|uniref:Peptidase M19 n=1 Tax=Sphingomonas turrisvirgatae TaxID=1888892 RepID=A0A1E3LWZ8_9SPHN|nr:dipeptidase [Sphingomonas turrisvirgatae]ODP38307.1 peptidase M19 [Sphingomonas turrisvirgatae]
MRNPFPFLLPLAAAACAAQSAGPAAQTAEMAPLHTRLMTMDTHLDTPVWFSNPHWKFGDRHDWRTDLAQVDLGRMETGALDGGMFVIYTRQGPVTPQGFAEAKGFAFKRLGEIERTIGAYPARIKLVTTAEQAIGAERAGQRFAFISIENSYPLGEDLSLLRAFYDRGVRMAGPVHSKDNQFADSATGAGTWKGLSPLGKRWVAEMNRLGMVIDGSHSSDAAFDQMLELSTAPIILSHSGPKAKWAHNRNIDDGRIRRLAAKGGAVCMNSVFLTKMTYTDERNRLEALVEKFPSMSAAEQAAVTAQVRALDRQAPVQDTDFENFMENLLYLLKVAGPDHVCMGADWDGGGGVRGFEDITALPRVTERLEAAGYSEADIAKIWSGNVLRILQSAQAARKLR